MNEMKRVAFVQRSKVLFMLQQETNHSNINVLYSTPSCYLYQLNRADQQWPTKSDDFFPYAHANHSFWTGYFTSRAALKGYVRETNTFLQVWFALVTSSSSLLLLFDLCRVNHLKNKTRSFHFLGPGAHRSFSPVQSMFRKPLSN